MRTVEKLEQILAIAQSHGYEIRHEYLAGNGGGICVYGSKKWMFVDLAQSVDDQYENACHALNEVLAEQPLENIRRAA